MLHRCSCNFGLPQFVKLRSFSWLRLTQTLRRSVVCLVFLKPDYVLNPKLLVNFLLDIEIIKNKISIYFQILVFQVLQATTVTLHANSYFIWNFKCKYSICNTKIHLKFEKNVKNFEKKTFSVLWMMWIMTNDDNVILSQKFSHKRFAQFKLFFRGILMKNYLLWQILLFSIELHETEGTLNNKVFLKDYGFMSKRNLVIVQKNVN